MSAVLTIVEEYTMQYFERMERKGKASVENWQKRRTSGKSTQNAFIFNPYKNPAKLSLNRARLSCISCTCIQFASKSAMASASSATAGSRASSGKTPPAPAAAPPPAVAGDRPPTPPLAMPREVLPGVMGAGGCEARRDVREEGRSGVVGREGMGFLAVGGGWAVDIVLCDSLDEGWQWMDRGDRRVDK